MNTFAGFKFVPARYKSASFLSLLAGPLLFTMFAAPTPGALAQANVVENEPAVIYVDAGIGSDSNDGTQATPLRTISAATAKAGRNNVKGIGTRVLINPGIYREAVTLAAQSGSTKAPITLQAVRTGTAVIAGSDVFTNWYQGTNNSAIYAHDWNYNFGPCPIPSGWYPDLQPIMLRREMVFVNGTPMTQVISFDQMQAGTFFVDEPGNKIQVWPGPGVDLNRALVEVSTRPTTITISKRDSVVLRGLVFEHASTCLNLDGAAVNSSNNVLVDSIQAVWNNWGGIGFNADTNTTVQNSVASYNGAVGFHGWRSKNALFQFNESDYNNWRGSMGALYDFGQGGAKFFMMHGATVNAHYSYNNQAQGLWFDTDNREIMVDGAVLAGNGVDNLQIELNAGPIFVQNSAICFGEGGVHLINSSQVTLVDNKLYNNGSNPYRMNPQFYLEGKQGGRNFVDWETGEYHNVISSNITFAGNIFEDGAVYEQVFGTYLTGSDWTTFASTFHSESNRWYDWIQSSAFTLPGGKKVSLATWKNTTGQDSSSLWAAPATATRNCHPPLPSYADFNLTTDNRTYSTVKGKATILFQMKSYGSTPIIPLGKTNGGTVSIGPVSLSTAPLPAGVTASFGTAPSTPSSMGASLTLTASQSAAAQTIPVTLIGTSGGRVHTVTVWVTIQPV